MARYIAFLRAINVGGHVVKMTDLRRHFEEAGFTSVETFIASGNVIFESDEKAADLESRIEAHLESALGYRVGTFIRTPRELADVVERGPFKGTTIGKDETHYVSFVRTRPTPAMRAAIDALDVGDDEVHAGKREVHWLCRVRGPESAKRGSVVGKAIGAESTMRNVNTVRKLAEKYR